MSGSNKDYRDLKVGDTIVYDGRYRGATNHYYFTEIVGIPVKILNISYKQSYCQFEGNNQWFSLVKCGWTFVEPRPERDTEVTVKMTAEELASIKFILQTFGLDLRVTKELREMLGRAVPQLPLYPYSRNLNLSLTKLLRDNLRQVFPPKETEQQKKVRELREQAELILKQALDLEKSNETSS